MKLCISEAARAYNLAAEEAIRDYIAARHPEAAERVADFVSTTMSGLSAKARNGHGLTSFSLPPGSPAWLSRRSFATEGGFSLREP